MSQNPLKQLMKEYDEAEKFANADLSSWPVKTLPGAQMRQRECKELVDTLAGKYADAVGDVIVTIFTTGPRSAQEAFAEIAKVEAETIVADSQSLYARLSGRCEESMGDRRTFGVTQLGILIGELTEVGRELNARNIPIPKIFDVTHCKTQQDVIDTVRNLVRGVVADALNMSSLSREVVKKALAIRYTKSVVPVVVIGASEEELGPLSKELFPGRLSTFTVDTTSLKALDKENVLQVFTSIRESLSKTKKKN